MSRASIARHRSRACPRSAVRRRKSGKPDLRGPRATPWIAPLNHNHITLRASGSRVSFRSRKRARCTRPGHETGSEPAPKHEDATRAWSLFLRPPFLRRRLEHHAFELHAIRVGEIDRVVRGLVILAGRIDHGHAVLDQERAERVHILAARKLERIMVKADVALAVLVLLALGVGGGDPEQRLAVAPARHVRILVLELEAEKAEHLAVEVLRAREVADAEHEVIDADDAGHGVLLSFRSRAHHPDRRPRAPISVYPRSAP